MSKPAMPQYFGKDLEAMSFAQNYHRWILKEIQPYLGKCAAEVGAGIGSFSELILGTGIEKLTSYEPSNNMYPALEERLRNEPRATTVNAFFGTFGEDNQFDTAIYVNVLEHVENDLEELVRVRRALTAQGRVIIFVPALQCLYSDLDRQVGHFRRYAKRELEDLVVRAGFEPIKSCYFDFAGYSALVHQLRPASQLHRWEERVALRQACCARIEDDRGDRQAANRKEPAAGGQKNLRTTCRCWSGDLRDPWS